MIKEAATKNKQRKAVKPAELDNHYCWNVTFKMRDKKGRVVTDVYDVKTLEAVHVLLDIAPAGKFDKIMFTFDRKRYEKHLSKMVKRK